MIESRERLLRFRYFFGLQARTLAQAKRIGRWAAENDEEFADIQACGHHFDLEACQLRDAQIPGQAQMAGMVVATAGLVCAALFSVVAFSVDRVLLKFNDSGAWFTLTSDRAVLLTGKGVITAQSCALGSDVHGFTQQEREAVCEAFKKPGMQEFVHESVVQQRAVLAPAAALFLCLALAVWRSLSAAAAARSMRARLRKRQPPSKGPTCGEVVEPA